MVWQAAERVRGACEGLWGGRGVDVGHIKRRAGSSARHLRDRKGRRRFTVLADSAYKA